MIQHQNDIIIIQHYSNITADNPDAREIFQDQRRYLKMTFATKSQIRILRPPLSDSGFIHNYQIHFKGWGAEGWTPVIFYSNAAIYKACY